MTTLFSRQRRFRRWHRRLALLTALQLLAWTVSGAFFAFVDIERVRGSAHRKPSLSGPLEQLTPPPLAGAGSELQLRWRLPGEVITGVTHKRETIWYDRQGKVLAPLSEEEALILGALATDLAPDTAEWVDEAPAGSEFRGAPLPLWRVYHHDAPSTVAYLQSTSGQVVALRNTAWRWWDFLWALHIMDYDTRDEIGTWLLKAFSLFAVATALAGLGIFIFSPQRRI